MEGMTKYSLVKIEQVSGQQLFEKLVVDDVAPFDVFVSELEERYRSELRTMYSFMNFVANNQSLPKDKFHPYSDGKDGAREYEFKTKHLRVYAIEKPGGKIIILGGKKSTQSKDTTYFRKLKAGYLKSL